MHRRHFGVASCFYFLIMFMLIFWLNIDRELYVMPQSCIFEDLTRLNKQRIGTPYSVT